MSELSRGSNAILKYLKSNKGEHFSTRSKLSVRENVIQAPQLLDECLKILSKDGYIRTYFDPAMKINMEGTKHDETVGYVIRTAGERFIARGGYKE